jgi:uncharacterized protein
MKIVALAIVMILGVGCVSSGDPTRFYVLNPMDPGPTVLKGEPSKAPLSLEISALRLPQYLERPQIVTRASPSRLDLAEFHQWGGNLRKDMLRVMAKNLSQFLATPHISISPHSPQVPPDFRLEMEVMKFERDPGGKVRLSIQWSLTAARDAKLLSAQITELESPSVTLGPDMEPTVTAMGLLWGELSRIIAEAVWKHASGRAVP